MADRFEDGHVAGLNQTSVKLVKVLVTHCHSIPSLTFSFCFWSLVFLLVDCSKLDFSLSGCRGQGSHFLSQQKDSHPTRTATTDS